MRRLLLLLVACSNLHGQDWRIVPSERVGPITTKVTREELSGLFPNAKIVDDQMELDEGMLSPATLVYKGELSRQLAIVWTGKSEQAHPKEIFICFERRSGPCDWRAANGIRVGTRLQDLEAKNGGPFTIAGFGWNYGGNVTSWDGGALSKWDKAGSLVFTLDADRLANGRYAVALTPEEEHSVQGDHPVSSNAPAMRKLDPRVVGMLFKFQSQ
ncbi:MAG TPA: hypothetical protein VHZ07_15340 [Bryobacteraceae bacterium]|nr:hypothetical protein [Bryobacteraceae bacterium]